jgi:hypothetical protein
MRHFRKFVSTLFLISLFGFVFATPASAQITQDWSGVCTDTGDATGVATIQGFQCLVGNVLQVAVSGIGLAGFVMMIVGAFKYLLSGGNAKGVDEGQKTMTYAVLGLVVALSAFFILNIIANFTGVYSILNFKIPSTSTNANTP